MLQIDIRDIPEQVQEKPGCVGIFFGFIVLCIFAFGIFDIIVNDNKKETEQVSTTQTAKKQSTTSTKKTSSPKSTTRESSPSTTNSSKSASSQSTSQTTVDGSKSTTSVTTASNSTSTTPTSTTVATTSASNTISDADLTYEIYLSLSNILEAEGKSLKLCEARDQTKGQEANVVGKMRQLRGTEYYNNALKDLVRCCPKYAKEYSKNGNYFASEAEFYQSYINPDYSSILKAKKKESR